MLEQLFKYEWALQKHLSAPMLRERGKNGADCYSKNGHAVTDLTRQS